LLQSRWASPYRSFLGYSWSFLHKIFSTVFPSIRGTFLTPIRW
jgi:hypothetical protein